jgi:hypothetical protein
MITLIVQNEIISSSFHDNTQQNISIICLNPIFLSQIKWQRLGLGIKVSELRVYLCNRSVIEKQEWFIAPLVLCGFLFGFW